MSTLVFVIRVPTFKRSRLWFLLVNFMRDISCVEQSNTSIFNDGSTKTCSFDLRKNLHDQHARNGISCVIPFILNSLIPAIPRTYMHAYHCNGEISKLLVPSLAHLPL